MPRKSVKVYIPVELKPILAKLVDRLGLTESEVMRLAFLEYAKEVGLVKERVLGFVQ